MVAIRLARVGAKKKPSYRVVVMDKRRARDSKSIEILGHYDPRPKPIGLSLNRERIDYWLGVGAQPSDTVRRLIKVYDEQGPSGPDAREKYVPTDVPEDEKLSVRTAARVAAAAAETEAEAAKNAEASAAPAEESSPKSEEESAAPVEKPSSEEPAKVAEAVAPAAAETKAEAKEEPKAEAKEAAKEEVKAEVKEEVKEEKKKEEAAE